MASTQQGILSLSDELSKSAYTAKKLHVLRSSSLISLGQLSRDNCTVILDKENLYAIKEEHIVRERYSNQMGGLWDIPIQKKSVQESNYKQLIQYGLSYSKSLALACRQQQSRIKSPKEEKTY